MTPDEILDLINRESRWFWSVKEIADLLAMSEQFVRDEIEKGAMPACYFGRSIRVGRSVLRLYVQTGERERRSRTPA
jgi:excisionase family DNA binding protein